MSDENRLPPELLWAAGGHASDVVLTALADGQLAIVPDAVRSHVERCTACTMHLGHAALLSLHVEGDLAARATEERALAKRPLPKAAIVLGLVVAALGALPNLGSARSIFRDAPLFLKGLHTLARRFDEPGTMLGLFVTYATALVLVALALVVVRFLPQKETSR